MKGYRLAVVLALVVYCIVGVAPVAMAAETQTIEEWTAVLDKNPNDAVAYFKRGAAYGREAQYDLALTDFDKAIELNPKYIYAILARGYMYEKKSLPDEALDNYTQAIKADPSFALPYICRAFINLRWKGQYDLAIQDCNKSIELDPKLTRAYQLKAQAYEKKNQYDDAIAVYRAYIANSTDSAGIEAARTSIRGLGGKP